MCSTPAIQRKSGWFQNVVWPPFEPVMLHEDAIRESLEQEVVVADAVQRPASDLMRVGGADVGEPRHDDQEEQTPGVHEAATDRHQ
jgi:hypothetical protein